MSTIGVESLDLWSREAMFFYLIWLVLGWLIMSHIVEAICIILNRAEENERAAAQARLKRSIRRYRKLTNGPQEAIEAPPQGRCEEPRRAAPAVAART